MSACTDARGPHLALAYADPDALRKRLTEAAWVIIAPGSLGVNAADASPPKDRYWVCRETSKELMVRVQRSSDPHPTETHQISVCSSLMDGGELFDRLHNTDEMGCCRARPLYNSGQKVDQHGWARRNPDVAVRGP